MTVKRPKITIDPDGTIHVDDKEKPAAPASNKLNTSSKKASEKTSGNQKTPAVTSPRASTASQRKKAPSDLQQKESEPSKLTYFLVGVALLIFIAAALGAPFITMPVLLFGAALYFIGVWLDL
ncbi:hypothetical protein [Collinsella sp. An268]|uniref:hypothetical protein n=1 Tax=Collinsella sp. An268 TaxID=1965612 RepID=UPI000B3816FF|nr:hypothetical protein [Collinsella sp. An268]OUO64195.1 hypothetical protein B5F70_06275 [Collinsella sp. An268]